MIDLKQFLFWKTSKNPQRVFEESLDEFVELVRLPAFKKYVQIVEWRLLNVGAQTMRQPKRAAYFEAWADGHRQILIDFKSLQRRAKEKKIPEPDTD